MRRPEQDITRLSKLYNSHVTAAPAEWHGRFKDFDLSKGTTDAKASAGQQRDATVSLW